ncbi:MAG: Kup system potassium uptake protein [Verrucomicrobiales bacterium]|nr:Kup system potassium uptake protein [Verrucomicrobiales bacterium]
MSSAKTAAPEEWSKPAVCCTIRDRKYLYGLTVGALGVVYGDIGTSPLYALRECFHGTHSIQPTPENVFGVLSLVFWSLITIVSIKYLTFIMRADNRGEGGILALMSLAVPHKGDQHQTRKTTILLAVGVFGAALLYGDGIITPAVTVMGAIEGLEIAHPIGHNTILVITVCILIFLFSFQRFGTCRVGKVFGPIMLVWFFTIALLGTLQIFKEPRIIGAINPIYGIEFLFRTGWTGFLVLGAVFLVVTGGEALYADLGHFGKQPIRLAWFAVVLPALFLNYLGQGALILSDPAAVVNPFYHLAPTYLVLPLVILATLASVIASQALISGAFSLTMQAVQLGYIPRLRIDHTSSDERGQIYIPHLNWTLMLACIGLVLGFGSSSNLAAAYGVAVTLTMIITTILFDFAARELWHWKRLPTMLLCSGFLIIELAFCAANMMKIAYGGWFPLLVGVIIYTLMTTWKTGRKILGDRLRASSLPLQMFLDDVLARPPHRVSGTAIFLSGNSEGTPLALLHNLKHNKVLHERIVLLTIETQEIPHVSPEDRVGVENLRPGVFRVRGRYGFMEEPGIPDLLRSCALHGLDLVPEKTTFFLSRETIIPTKMPGMALWREKLFAYMARNAQRATAYFKLPANRVVELGMQVEM